jgi:quercetin dioxygenase-like cupin family protein
MESMEIENQERRRLLCALPMAAVAGLALADGSLLRAQDAGSGDAGFQVIDGQQVEDAVKSLEANPGNKILYESKTLSWMLTYEKAKTAKEFEWHEHRDHIFHILDGSTTYELGGTPQNTHSPKPGEWLAPSSDGAKTVTLSKGEFLVIPRGTPHRRTTKESVLFALIAPISA